MESEGKYDKSKLQKSVSPAEEIDGANCKLTLEELRNCEGFANVSDREGKEMTENLYRLSLIAFNYEAKK